MLECFHADLPPDLAWADDLLTRYGRWATGRGRGTASCGSAERAYRTPVRGDDDTRRLPMNPALDAVTAMAAQRALVRVPAEPRMVLHVLYVPNRVPVAARLRRLQIRASVCRELHLVGLRLFGTIYRQSVDIRRPNQCNPAHHDA